MLKLFFTNDSTSALDAQIDDVLVAMGEAGVTTEKYSELMVKLEKLNEIKAKSRKPRVSNDTIAMVLGNLAGILIIVMYEQKHVLSSKGFTERIPLKLNSINTKSTPMW